MPKESRRSDWLRRNVSMLVARLSVLDSDHLRLQSRRIVRVVSKCFMAHIETVVPRPPSPLFSRTLTFCIFHCSQAFLGCKRHFQHQPFDSSSCTRVPAGLASLRLAPASTATPSCITSYAYTYGEIEEIEAYMLTVLQLGT